MTARKLSRRVALRGGAAAVALAGTAVAAVPTGDPVVNLARRVYELEGKAVALQDSADKLEIAAMKGREYPRIVCSHYRKDATPHGELVPVYTDSEDEIRRRSELGPSFCKKERAVARDRQLAELAENESQHRAYLDRCGVTAAESKANAVWRSLRAAEDTLFATPAASHAGAAAKARVALYLNRGFQGDECDERADAALADLDRLAGAS